MAEYTITSPDGKEHTITAPDGATEQEVLDFAKASFEKSNEEAASQASMDKTKSIAGTTASVAGGGANLLPTTIGKDLSRFGKGALSVAPKALAEVGAATFSGGAIPPGAASTALSVLQPGSSAKGLGNLLRGGAKVGAKALGPAGTAYSAYDLYDTATDPNSTATDYILPTVGTAAGIPTAYAMGKPVVKAGAPVVKAVAPYAKAGGQLINKGLQAAIPPSKAVYEAAEAQAKARATQIANIGRKFALDKLIPGMASKVLGPISAVGGMVVPSASESDYKYQFPITGPAKGSEINQQTGQPWTRQELDAYYTQFPEEPGLVDQLSGFLSEQFSNNK
jgi:hypothetical protein